MAIAEGGDRETPAVTVRADRPTELPPAWEQIEAGRYRPRRIRGSFPGRELG
jgi:hypothetical protein